MRVEPEHLIEAARLRALRGEQPGVEASANKIFWSELDLRMHETALRILGERGELLPEAPAAGDVDTWLEGYLFAQAGTIYAGSPRISSEQPKALIARVEAWRAAGRSIA